MGHALATARGGVHKQDPVMAGLTTVIARRGEDNLEDLGAFVINPGVDGCEREPMEDLLGLRGAGFCNMNLNGVMMSADHHLKGSSAGWSAITKVIDTARLGAAAPRSAEAAAARVSAVGIRGGRLGASWRWRWLDRD